MYVSLFQPSGAWLTLIQNDIEDIFFSIKRKSHVKKVRFTICNNLYGVHNIIANHTSGPFVLRFSSCTSVIVQVTSVSQQCIVPGFSFLIAEEVGIPKKVRS